MPRSVRSERCLVAVEQRAVVAADVDDQVARPQAADERSRLPAISWRFSVIVRLMPLRYQ